MEAVGRVIGRIVGLLTLCLIIVWALAFLGPDNFMQRARAQFSNIVGTVQVGQPVIQGNATGSTGAVVGTLAAVAGKTTYICGFSVAAQGGTAAVGPITIAGLITASQIWHLTSSATGVTITQAFQPCIPASATNTAITVTTTADGSATAVDVNSWGYQQ